MSGHWTVKSRQVFHRLWETEWLGTAQGKGPMIVFNLTTYVESMQGSVVDLNCSLQNIPLFCFLKTALRQYPCSSPALLHSSLSPSSHLTSPWFSSACRSCFDDLETLSSLANEAKELSGTYFYCSIYSLSLNIYCIV